MAVLALAVVTSCSLALSWNQNGLPCEYDAASNKYSCLSGYTCALRNLGNPNDNLCIQNHTIPMGGNCQKDIQCVVGGTCPSGTCMPVCDPNTAYQRGACDLTYYCKPFYTTSGYTDRETPTVALEGACVPTDSCSIGNACTPGGGTANSGTCLAVNAATSACVLACTPFFSSNTTATSYQDQCSPTGGYYASCQAVGPTGSEATTCVTQFPVALGEGTACNDSVSQPCATGFTCWAGQCASWCPVTDSPGSACRTSGQYCCPTNLTSSQNILLGYCVNSEANCAAN